MRMDMDGSALRGFASDLGKLSAAAVPAASHAIRKTALAIEADAKALAPVDTGNLRNSISTSAYGLSAEVGPTAEYGLFVEQGTSVNSPQPFLAPAFDRRVRGLEQALGQLIAGGLG